MSLPCASGYCPTASCCFLRLQIRVRELDHDTSTTTRRILRPNSAFQQIRQLLDNREPDPAASYRRLGVQRGAVERLENMLAFANRNTRPLIIHPETRMLFEHGEAHVHALAARAILHCVVEQVVEDLAERSC